MMVKICSPAGWSFDRPATSLMKIASDGRMGYHDRREFLKFASNSFIDRINSGEIKFAEDEEPVHLIALGAFEKFGSNRNGDAFHEDVCKQYHHTFEKFAKFYRSHKNKNPEISYGVVKASAYNPAMQWIELLCGLNKTAAAAERNHGLIADKELQKLANGDNLAVSMACSVPHDTCSFCGNQARTRSEYCDANMCKAGGCKDNLSKVVKVGKDLHRLHVKNASPRWFDISDVYRPADPVAYGNRADWIQKAAEDGGCFEWAGGAKMAEDLGLIVPMHVLMHSDVAPHLAEQIKLAYALAELEEVPGDRRQWSEFSLAFSPAVQPPLPLQDLGLHDGREKLAEVLSALTDNMIIVSLRDFSAMTKRAALCDSAATKLLGAYSRMRDDGSLEQRLENNPYAYTEKRASLAVRERIVGMRPCYSLENDDVHRRCVVASIRGVSVPNLKFAFEKQAHDDQNAEDLVRDYAAYKVAALQRIAQFDGQFLLTARLASCQNRII